MAIDDNDKMVKLMNSYVDALCDEIVLWWDRFRFADENGKRAQLKSIYFWWWTPLTIWIDNIIRIINIIIDSFDVEDLWEFSIECNPYPEEDVYNAIKIINKKYKKFPRIRWSFGLQTFDSEILKESGRLYSFPAIVDFLRWLVDLKADNNVFNFDFIAFGKFNQNKKWDIILWDEYKWNFLVDFVSSYFADGFSLYTLELFPGSVWYHEQIVKNNHVDQWLWLKKYGSDDDVYAEFEFIKNLFEENAYRRYELSNFALPWKASIHNNVYRNMENYIWVGTSASSFLKWNLCQSMSSFLNIENDVKSVRWSNTKVLMDYVKWSYVDKKTVDPMDERDFRIEKVFLALRTQAGIENVSSYSDLFVSDWEEKIKDWTDRWLVDYYEDILVLTDKWMDVYNSIITDLFADV